MVVAAAAPAAAAAAGAQKSGAGLDRHLHCSYNGTADLQGFPAGGRKQQEELGERLALSQPGTPRRVADRTVSGPINISFRNEGLMLTPPPASPMHTCWRGPGEQKSASAHLHVD